ncbi:hypothetical protein C8R44DRAFT_974177 [Mycena epipterygia]|nr:hypothetical protein C8R44DRAFT_974177 [Mycena epipterygia]
MTQIDIAAYIANWNAPIFSGHVYENVQIWISSIRDGLWNVPSEHWVDVASHFLGERPKSILDNVQQMMAKLDSKDAFTRTDQCRSEDGGFGRYPTTDDGKAGLEAGIWHWDWATFARILVHVHGSVAAGIQSTVYGGAVSSGSIFAMAQSAAAGGIIRGSQSERFTVDSGSIRLSILGRFRDQNPSRIAYNFDRFDSDFDSAPIQQVDSLSSLGEVRVDDSTSILARFGLRF